MQNSQFRSLLVSKPPSNGQDGAKRPSMLGARARASPMTPRNVKPAYTTPRTTDGEPPRKKFKNSSAPRGSKIATGYIDRTQERLKAKEEEEEEDETRKAPDKVKGLDFEALARARKEQQASPDEVDLPQDVIEEKPEQDVEDELEKALEREVIPQAKQRTDSSPQGHEAPSEQHVLSRNEILAQLKQNRGKNASYTTTNAPPVHAPEPVLDQSKFKKLASTPKPGKHKYTETVNGRRREVLVITNNDGTTKRKTRWLDPELMPEDKTKADGVGTAWGGDVPEQILARQKALEDSKQDDDNDDDIFGGVEDYDPLAGIDSDDEAESTADKPPPTATQIAAQSTDRKSPDTDSETTSRPRNYFATESDNTSQKFDPSKDPHILAALKRAAQLRRDQAEADHPTSTSNPTTKAAPNDDSANDAHVDRNKALLAKLQKQSGGADDIDMDLGFGGSRYDDDDEDDNDGNGAGAGKVKLSQWRGLAATGRGVDDDDDDDNNENGSTKQTQKKKNNRTGGGGGRGKKRKGDKNSFKDVMSVLERRKGG